MRARATATAAACAVLGLVPLAGCGGGDKPTIPHDEGATLIRLLKQARSEAGDPKKCDALLRTVSSIQANVSQLPASVDTDTRRSLTDGVDNLAQTAQQECQNAQTTPETTPTTESAPAPQPTTTETTPPTTTETTPPPTSNTTPPPKTTPGNGNGNGGAGIPPNSDADGPSTGKKDKPHKKKDPKD